MIRVYSQPHFKTGNYIIEITVIASSLSF